MGDKSKAPHKVFNGFLILYRTADYAQSGSPPSARMNLMLGNNIPVKVLDELDSQIDDGLPESGALRHAATTGAIFGPSAESSANCVDNSVKPAIWNVAGKEAKCNAVFLF